MFITLFGSPPSYILAVIIFDAHFYLIDSFSDNVTEFLQSSIILLELDTLPFLFLNTINVTQNSSTVPTYI